MGGERLMVFVQHVSVRVPWHDTDWSGRVCADPLANSSCMALENIRSRRNGRAEAAVAGADWRTLDSGSLPPCVIERGGFMSRHDHWTEREHPYRSFPALHGLRPARTHVPAFSVPAIPYFWLHRDHTESLLQEQP